MRDRDRQPAGVEADKKIRSGKNVVHVKKCIIIKKYGIQKSTTGRMTLFSESGILSVKTGGIRDGKGKSNNEKLGALCI